MSDPKAHAAVSKAIREGRLAKQPCIRCGMLPAHAHHDDYGKPLDVIWLCRKHHAELHHERGDYIRDNGPPMPRISCSLSDQQMEWLRAEARRIGITVGELLRRIIDQSRLEIRSPQ